MVREVRRERVEVRGKPPAVAGQARGQIEVCGGDDEVPVLSLGLDPRDERRKGGPATARR